MDLVTTSVSINGQQVVVVLAVLPIGWTIGRITVEDEIVFVGPGVTYLDQRQALTAAFRQVRSYMNGDADASLEEVSSLAPALFQTQERPAYLH